jgi:hypothetical protein
MFSIHIITHAYVPLHCVDWYVRSYFLAAIIFRAQNLSCLLHPLTSTGGYVMRLWAIRQFFFTNAPKRRKNRKREWKINTRIKTQVLWKSKFCMHVWRKKFGGLDKNKLQKMRIQFVPLHNMLQFCFTNYCFRGLEKRFYRERINMIPYPLLFTINTLQTHCLVYRNQRQWLSSL